MWQSADLREISREDSWDVRSLRSLALYLRNGWMKQDTRGVTCDIRYWSNSKLTFRVSLQLYLHMFGVWNSETIMWILDIVTCSQTGWFFNHVINFPYCSVNNSYMYFANICNPFTWYSWCGGCVLQHATFENVPTAFKWWARFILTRVTGGVTCMHSPQRVTCWKVPKTFPLKPRVV